MDAYGVGHAVVDPRLPRIYLYPAGPLFLMVDSRQEPSVGARFCKQVADPIAVNPQLGLSLKVDDSPPRGLPSIAGMMTG